MSGLGSFVAELQRRRVYRVAVVYVAVAFAVLQGADLLVPALHLPGWIVTLVAVLAILGFPLALVLAWAFDITPEGVRRTAPRPEDGTASLRSPRLVRGAGVALVALSLAAVGWLAWSRFFGGDDGAALDPDVVAVLPFRVAGAEPSLRYLREGMLDLLATKLSGEGGPRAVDPRSLVSAWREMVASDDVDLPPDSARALARLLHAGRVVLGELVSTPGRVVLSASLYGVADRETPAPVSVEGPPDSIPALVDRLAGTLLSVGAGEASDRIAALTSTSLPALRAYLDGQALYRRADYSDAESRFRRAVELDSTFALAALGAYQATKWGVSENSDPDLLARAWRWRQRLGPRDRAFLTAVAGPRYPGRSSIAERLATWEDAVRRMPDRAEAWFELGDLLVHDGRLVDADRSLDRTAAALRRSVQLDPTFGSALQHLTDHAAFTRDSAEFRHYRALSLRRDPRGLYRWFLWWESSAIFGDTGAARLVRDSLDAIGLDELAAYLIMGQLTPAGADISRGVEGRLASRAHSPQERIFAYRLLHDYALNGGRPARALQLTDSLRTPENPTAHLRLRITDALFGDGDTVAAAAAARELAAHTAEPGPVPAWAEVCTLSQWRLWHEQPVSDAAIAQLRSGASARTAADSVGSTVCAELLEAHRSAVLRRPDARARLERLDSLLASGPPTSFLAQADFALARLLDAAGNREGALRAIRRRSIGPDGVAYLSTHLREEGRLAALTGDRAGAIAAYRHFLFLQADPEPAARPEVEQVRAELARLVGER